MEILFDKPMYLILALITTLVFIIVVFKYAKIYEGYSNLDFGYYPIDVNVPILYEDYPLKKKMGVSNNSYQMNSSYYPIFGSSYGQYTNNVRYWSTPNNGLCSPAIFCGGLYENKKLDIPPTPDAIPFSSPDIRVNYYKSDKLVCQN